MKKILTTLVICGFTCCSHMADEVKTPYVIKQGEKSFAVRNMPTFTTSEPISNSFVYIDDEYVEPPYIVSISNLAVCINGKVIHDFAPLVWISPFYVETRPELPQGINVETSMYDESLNKYILSTSIYLLEVEKLDRDKAEAEMIRVYQSLPNVKNVERKNPFNYNITYQDGEIVSTSILPLMGRQPPYRLNTVGTHIDQLYESYTNRLTQGFQIKIKQGVEIEGTKLPKPQ